MNRRTAIALGTGTAALAATGGLTPALAESEVDGSRGLSDVALARSLRGDFRSRYARVNGIRLHYVIGGRGEPLVLLPGWPQTWWEYRKIMSALADRYRVIVVDLRGMGGSDKPLAGYDKKTAASDVHELVRQLGYDHVDIVGHDIGSMIAYSFAVNHPAATRTVTLMDVPHPNKFMYNIPMLAPDQPVHVWWFAFNQLRGLPEQLLSGPGARHLADWIFDNLTLHPDAISNRDRDIFARAYANPDAIRAGNGWYQTFPQDIEDQETYGLVTAPLLGLGSEFGYDSVRDHWPTQGTDVRVIKVPDCGHFLVEEQPTAVLDHLIRFLGGQ